MKITSIKSLSVNQWALIVLSIGFAIRFLLFAFTPVNISFDDHFEPVRLWIEQGNKPLSVACFECYQPPLYYFLFWMLSKVLLVCGFIWEEQLKILQFFHLLIGCFTLLFSWIFLKKLEFSDWAKIASLSVLVLLPRHIYMSVMFSNDSLLYLFMVLSFLALYRWLKSKSWYDAIFLAAVASMAILTKSNGLVILPILGFIFIGLIIQKQTSRIMIYKVCLVLIVPLLVFTGYTWEKHKELGNPFKMNVEILNFPLNQQPANRLDYFSFKPWQFIHTPTLSSENLNSFFTVIFARMWVEGEPKYSIYFDEDKNGAFWFNQNIWLNDANLEVGPDTSLLSFRYKLVNGILVLIGLVFLGIMLVGGLVKIKEFIKSYKSPDLFGLMLVALILGNTLGIVLITLQYPFYSFVKAAFFLVSIPAFLYFSALGFQSLSHFKGVKNILTGVILLLVVLVTYEVLIFANGAA